MHSTIFFGVEYLPFRTVFTLHCFFLDWHALAFQCMAWPGLLLPARSSPARGCTATPPWLASHALASISGRAALHTLCGHRICGPSFCSPCTPYPLPLPLASRKPAVQKAMSHMKRRFLQQWHSRLSPTTHERVDAICPHRATACQEHRTGCSCMMSTQQTSWIHRVDLLVRTGPEGTYPQGAVYGLAGPCWPQ